MPDARADESSDSIVAAVDSINAADLGRPVSASFSPMTGKGGRSMFPNAKQPRKSVVNSWRSGFIEVRDATMLRANADAWGLADISAGASSDQRYLVFQVTSIEHTLELDDAVDMRVPDADAAAAADDERRTRGEPHHRVGRGWDMEATHDEQFGIQFVRERADRWRRPARDDVQLIEAVVQPEAVEPVTDGRFELADGSVDFVFVADGSYEVELGVRLADSLIETVLEYDLGIFRTIECSQDLHT
jgi:hypothetical protein